MHAAEARRQTGNFYPAGHFVQAAPMNGTLSAPVLARQHPPRWGADNRSQPSAPSGFRIGYKKLPV